MLSRGYQQAGLDLVERQGIWFLKFTDQMRLDPDLGNVVTLIQDCILYANRPDLAVDLALACHPTVERWATWGEWSVALDHALIGCRTMDRPLDLIHLLNHRSQSARETGFYDDAITFATEAYNLAEQHNEPGLMAAALNKIALVTFYRDNLLQAQAIWDRAYTLGEGHASAMEMGHICNNLGLFYIARNDFMLARQYFDQATEHYAAHSDPVHLAKVSCNLAMILLEENSIDEAISSYKKALDLFTATNSRHHEGKTLNSLGYAYLKKRSLTLAYEFFQLAIKKLEESKATRSKAWAVSNLAELHVVNNAWSDAEVALDEAYDLATLCEMPLLVAAIEIDRGSMRLKAYNDKVGARKSWHAALKVQLEKGALLAAQKTQKLLDSLDD